MTRFSMAVMVRASLVALAVVAVGMATPVAASVLNVAWEGDQATDSHYVGLGAAPDGAANTFWNSFGTAGGHDWSELSPLQYSDGSAATGVSIQLNDVNSYTPPGTPVLGLFRGQINAQDENTTVSIDVLGLDNSQKYNVYLYSARSDAEIDPVTFTVNGVSQSLAGSANTSTFVRGDNYLLFAAQSPTDGALNIAWTGKWGGPFNALQVTGVPEPSMMVLTVIGVFGLLAYAWRKRK